jgi:hypothetical protein
MSFIHKHHMKEPVHGTALVAKVNSWRGQQKGFYTVEATLVVEADGVPKTTVEHSEAFVFPGDKLDRWPQQGATVPVLVDRDDPTTVRFVWDDMPSMSAAVDAAETAQAQQLIDGAYAEDHQHKHR